jgi:hypothetical protein
MELLGGLALDRAVEAALLEGATAAGPSQLLTGSPRAGGATKAGSPRAGSGGRLPAIGACAVAAAAAAAKLHGTTGTFSGATRPAEFLTASAGLRPKGTCPECPASQRIPAIAKQRPCRSHALPMPCPVMPCQAGEFAMHKLDQCTWHGALPSALCASVASICSCQGTQSKALIQLLSAMTVDPARPSPNPARLPAARRPLPSPSCTGWRQRRKQPPQQLRLPSAWRVAQGSSWRSAGLARRLSRRRRRLARGQPREEGGPAGAGAGRQQGQVPGMGRCHVPRLGRQRLPPPAAPSSRGSGPGATLAHSSSSRRWRGGGRSGCLRWRRQQAKEPRQVRGQPLSQVRHCHHCSSKAPCSMVPALNPAAPAAAALQAQGAGRGRRVDRGP